MEPEKKVAKPTDIQEMTLVFYETAEEFVQASAQGPDFMLTPEEEEQAVELLRQEVLKPAKENP